MVQLRSNTTIVSVSKRHSALIRELVRVLESDYVQVLENAIRIYVALWKRERLRSKLVVTVQGESFDYFIRRPNGRMSVIWGRVQDSLTGTLLCYGLSNEDVRLSLQPILDELQISLPELTYYGLTTYQELIDLENRSDNGLHLQDAPPVPIFGPFGTLHCPV